MSAFACVSELVCMRIRESVQVCAYIRLCLNIHVRVPVFASAGLPVVYLRFMKCKICLYLLCNALRVGLSLMNFVIPPET